MTMLRRIAFIGTALPRRCGIATFTTDLHAAIKAADRGLAADIVAVTDDDQAYDYPEIVQLEIREGVIDDYIHAADALNSGGFDIVCIQHEFGIFGGDAGSHLLWLLRRLRIPVVTTLHTVLAEPTADQKRVLSAVIEASSRIVVMAEKGRQFLCRIYGAPAEKIAVVPHGIFRSGFEDPEAFKRKLGFAGRSVILTFGLLSPNKGLETVIDALPSILARRPDAVYVILGATHPHLLRRDGETYREQLMERARQLGVQDAVVFANHFVDRSTLLDHIAMSDIYVTPYLNEAQMTSGTLAQSFGMGRAVVSTPYWHAAELLSDGRGVLVPFSDAEAVGQVIGDLLTDEQARNALRRRAYEHGRAMAWDQVAERYLDLFEDAVRHWRPRPVPQIQRLRRVRDLPEPNLTYLEQMSDDTGLYQHAVGCVPDRAHGYCVDDNARALLLACHLSHHAGQRLPDLMVSRYAAFIQHAWNPDTLHFRNFMGFSRQWLEPRGSQDSHGRTLWALGEAARSDPHPARRQWARNLFRMAMPTAAEFPATRAQVFTLLGLDAYCEVEKGDVETAHLRDRMASNLLGLFKSNATPDWCWFEDGLSYDNPRLCQALILTARATGSACMRDAGLRSLRWLAGVQTSPEGMFRPVGSESFGDVRTRPRIFDQQPLEAAAMVAACEAASQVDDDPFWLEEAARAFAWFEGHNDQCQSMVDEDGACRDGLRPDGLNQNRGGESVLSYLLALIDLRRMVATDAKRHQPIPIRA
ncbi:glycosyltransferase family 4 protein [Niveispirillum cyanobacteriorum]|uniref:Glycosyl transferase family 1 n=1 Tax=Niveispirillum cyanobacteriorum TaxID=1612173 RepID=A0A2K9NIH5_9PROT|nr:glycosyltransferase family 4 protein [Niveispirillum cyanobacteriorum]AUN32873.1 glycosyl transferase family 1 [Niveispirillum cyanobacteriorum]